MSKIQKTTTVENIESQFETASCFWSPPIFKQKDWISYGIRIVTSSSYNNRSWLRNTSYDYFDINSDGIITSAPRWFAKMKGTLVTNIKERAQ